METLEQVPVSTPPRVTPPERIPPGPNRFAAWSLGILIGGFCTVAFLSVAIWFATGMTLPRLFGLLHFARTQINVDQPTVVRQIQQLQKLETVSYTMDKIISGEHTNPYIPKFLAGDRLLLVVHGEVVGGVDLAKVKSSDITIHGREISIHIPAAELFSTRIDNAKTRVYSRDTGLFSSPDPNLESEVREEAERQLQQAAMQDGILKSAGENAHNTLSSLLKGFGFTQVSVQ